jgi:hypothetical protein
MRDPKALALFKEIRKKTEAGTLKWQETAEVDNFIAPMLGKYTLKLRPFTDEWGELDAVPLLIVEGEQGKEIMQISKSVDGITDEDLRALLVFAKRIATNADEQIDELLKGIKDLPDDEEEIPF